MPKLLLKDIKIVRLSKNISWWNIVVGRYKIRSGLASRYRAEQEKRLLWEAINNVLNEKKN